MQAPGRRADSENVELVEHPEADQLTAADDSYRPKLRAPRALRHSSNGGEEAFERRGNVCAVKRLDE
jgi:hypothetical protein